MPNAHLISANTLLKDVKEVYDITKAVVKDKLKVYPLLSVNILNLIVGYRHFPVAFM